MVHTVFPWTASGMVLHQSYMTIVVMDNCVSSENFRCPSLCILKMVRIPPGSPICCFQAGVPPPLPLLQKRHGGEHPPNFIVMTMTDCEALPATKGC